MNIDANDPKWTAYALGEITDARELTEMEAVLRQSPEIAAIVEDIRETAGWLKEELAAEPTERLTPAQRERIEAKASKPSGFLFGWKPAWTYALATVAVVVIAFIAVRPFLQTDVSQNDPTLIAEVTKKPSPAPFVDEIDFARTESTRSPGTSTPIQSGVVVRDEEKIEALPSNATMAQRAVVNDPNVFVAPRAIPREIPPPQMEELQMSVPQAIGNTGIGTAVRAPEPDTSLLPTLEYKASSPSPPLILPKPKTVPQAVTSGIGAGRGTGTANAARSAEQQPRRAFEMPSNDISVTKIHNLANLQGGPDTDEELQQALDPRQSKNFNTEDYDSIRDNPFLNVMQNPLSTFSIDVDTASYSNMRRFLNSGGLPPKDSVRIEELVNYFDYDYKAPRDGKPFAANVEMTEAPWNPKNRLLRIGLKARVIDEGKRPESNLVFLIDVS